MSKEQLVTRMLCSESKVDSSLLRGGAGEIKEEDWYRLTRAAGELSDPGLFRISRDTADSEPLTVKFQLGGSASYTSAGGG